MLKAFYLSTPHCTLRLRLPVLALVFICCLDAARDTSSSCDLVYIDLGSNNGEGISTFADGRPEPRVGAALAHVTLGSWSPRASCAYSVEANPRFDKVLSKVEKKIKSQLFEAKIRTSTAVTADDRKQVELLVPSASDDAGSVTTSIVSRPSRNNVSTVAVPAVRFVPWLKHVLMRHPSSRSLLLRMDVEGAEYELLLDLAASRVLDLLHKEGWRVVVLVEWHQQHKQAAAARLTPDRLATVGGWQAALKGLPPAQAAEASAFLRKYSWVRRSRGQVASGLESLLAYQFDTQGAMVLKLSGGDVGKASATDWASVLRGRSAAVEERLGRVRTAWRVGPIGMNEFVAQTLKAVTATA